MTPVAEKVEKKQQDAVEKLLEEFRPFLTRAINDGVKIGAEETRRTLASQLMGGTIVGSDGAPKRRDKTVKHAIQCPVKGCTRPGIKPLNNFCRQDYDSLGKKEREKLRTEQLERRKADAAKAAEKAKKAAAEASKASAA